MTEKKKRGRPPGSGKKATNKEPKYIKSPLEPLVEAVNKAMEEKGLTPLFISNPEKIKASDLFDFPEGWDKMGKIERLKWFKSQNK